MTITRKNLTLSNIGFFLQGEGRKIADDFFGALPDHIKEQVAHRKQLVEKKSPECLEGKECKICKCTIPDLFYADKSCDGNCYPVMKSLQEWNNYKDNGSI